MDNSRLHQLLWLISVIELNNFWWFYINCYTKMYFKPDHFKWCSLPYISSSSSFANSMPECVRGCKMTPNSSVLCLPHIRVESDIQWCKQDRSPCSGSWVHIVLWRSFSLYHTVSGFLIAASKALRRSSFADALATWPNKYHWFRWLMSPEK